MLDRRRQVHEQLVQQKLRHPGLEGVPLVRLYEDGSPEELEDPVRVDDLELIQMILEAVDKEHESLWVDA